MKKMYYKMNISCLYLSNWFDLILKKILVKKSKFNKKWQIKRSEIDWVIFKIHENSYKKQIKKIMKPNLQLNQMLKDEIEKTWA
jgi:hypothetical protein